MQGRTAKQSFSFREAEVGQLMKWAVAGESALILGVSGVGKSNLFNHLLDSEVQEHYLQDAANDFIMCKVNLDDLPDATDRSIYSLILEQFEILDPEANTWGLSTSHIEKIGHYHEALLDAGNDALKVRRYFRLAIRILLMRPSMQLVLMFDQFDSIYTKADPRLFANLRGLREAYKYRISYFVFSRILPEFASEEDRQREEFVELLAANILGLKPYGSGDALNLLKRVSARNQFPLDEGLATRMIAVSGGHAGLLKAAYMATLWDRIELPESDDAANETLLVNPNVAAECGKIWNSISVEEQRFLAACVHSLEISGASRDEQWQLALKGLVTEGEPCVMSGSLFGAFVGKQESVWENPVYLDRATRHIWVRGKRMGGLTETEYRLFSTLYERIGELVSKDELAAAGWPDAKGAVTDGMLTTGIYRIRKKLELDSKESKLLETVPSQGWRLNAE